LPILITGRLYFCKEKKEIRGIMKNTDVAGLCYFRR
jgi:hypothetical protein